MIDPDLMSDDQLVEWLGMADSVDGPQLPKPFDKLNPMQLAFARLYVLTRGDGVRSARLAGYKHPEVKATHLSLHPVVSELVKVLALSNASACLPVAVAALLDIARDKTIDPKTRRNAALDLAKIAGAMPKASPQTAIQVNTSSAPADGGGAAPSVVIQNVWNRRELRQMSEIDATMSDSLPALPDPS